MTASYTLEPSDTSLVLPKDTLANYYLLRIAQIGSIEKSRTFPRASKKWSGRYASRPDVRHDQAVLMFS